MEPSDPMTVARSFLPGTIELRRRLHRVPEVGLDLPRTQAIVLGSLDGLGLSVSTGDALTSVVGVLDGAGQGPTVLLRADMDALPVVEATGLPFASELDGAMHACGHDAHMAMLVGAARLLAGRRNELHGRVAFVFQPGEEGHGGGRIILEEGLLDRWGSVGPVVATFALHVWPTMPSGVAHTRGGPLMASSDILHAEFVGKGGHASAPHLALDPVPVAAEAVLALQTYVARRTDPLDPVVLTIGQISSGTASNVIPEAASLLGTLRALSEDARARVKREVPALLEGLARAHGLEGRSWWEDGYPVTVNDPGIAGVALDVATDVLGAENAVDMPLPVMASEDFSYLLQRVPGAMVFLGVRPPGVDDPAPLHSNRMILDEDAMAAGIALHAAFTLLHLAGPAGSMPGDDQVGQGRSSNASA
jgi:hippurate hydrolase